jgi:hypothetical protein
MTTVRQITHAHVHLLIDTFDDVVSILKAIKELEKFGIGLGAQWLVGKVPRDRKDIGSNDTIHISIKTWVSFCFKWEPISCRLPRDMLSNSRLMVTH